MIWKSRPEKTGRKYCNPTVCMPHAGGADLTDGADSLSILDFRAEGNEVAFEYELIVTGLQVQGRPWTCRLKMLVTWETNGFISTCPHQFVGTFKRQRDVRFGSL
jgi:hypothetical protein